MFSIISESKENKPDHRNITDTLSPEESAVFKLILNGYNTIEQLEMVAGMSVEKLNSILSILELEDYIAVRYGQISVLAL